MDIRDLTLIPRTVKAVQFVEGQTEAIRQWVQDKLPFQNVVSTAEKLYLPSTQGVDIVELGDWVFYDPQDKVFRGVTDGAVQAYYQDVTEVAPGAEEA